MKKNKIIIILIVILILVLIISITMFSLLKKENKSQISIGGQDVPVNESSGLYADKYQKGTYIYQGKNPNNYVNLNGDLWRIISIDENGNIKLISNEIVTEREFDSKAYRDINGENTAGTYCKDADEGCNAWAAHQNLEGSKEEVVNGNFKGTVTKDSELLTYLNDNYYNYISSYNIINHSVNIGSVKYESNLKSQTNDENSNTWNGKVALISLSDYVKASSEKNCDSLTKINENYEKCSNNNWLYLEDYNWWTLTPVSNASVELWYIGDAGYIDNTSADQILGIRPIIYLSKNIKFKGNGTLNNPYELSN